MTIEKKKPNKIHGVIIIAPSGAGKNTVIRELFATAEVHKNCLFKESVSDTTREKKTGEVDGVDYNFISREEFQRKWRLLQEYIECEPYAGNLYGSPKSQLFQNIQEGKITVYNVEPHGAEEILNFIGEDHTLIFSLIVSEEELEKRSEKRGRDTAEIRQLRKEEDKLRKEKMLELGIRVPYDTGANAGVTANKIYNHIMGANQS